MSCFYQTLNYPTIPTQLLNENNRSNIFTIGQEDDGSLTQFDRGHQQVPWVLYQIGNSNDPNLIDWLANNIKPPKEIAYKLWRQHIASHLRIRTSDGTLTNGQIFKVHSDYQTAGGLFYFWDLGGDNVTTTWYKEQELGLRRSVRTARQETVNFDSLVPVDSVVAQSHQWYLFCATVLHDVQHITRIRKYLTINFDSHEQLESFGFSKFNFDLVGAG